MLTHTWGEVTNECCKTQTKRPKQNKLKPKQDINKTQDNIVFLCKKEITNYYKKTKQDGQNWTLSSQTSDLLNKRGSTFHTLSWTKMVVKKTQALHLPWRLKWTINGGDGAAISRRTSWGQPCNGSHYVHHKQNSRASTFSTRTRTHYHFPELGWQST